MSEKHSENPTLEAVALVAEGITRAVIFACAFVLVAHVAAKLSGSV